MIPLNNGINNQIINILDHTLYRKGWEDIVPAYAEFGIEMVSRAGDNVPGDCRTWAFRLLGLEKYSFESSDIPLKDFTPMMKEGKIPELTQTDSLEVGDLVAYFFIEYPNYYDHLGVCVSFRGDVPIIESKWGQNGYLVRHPLRSIRKAYGDHVEFYRVQK